MSDTHYREVLDGYVTAEGQLEAHIAGERIFATIMMVRIYAIVHDVHHGVCIGETGPVTAPPTFVSNEEYVSRRGDVGAEAGSRCPRTPVRLLR